MKQKLLLSALGGVVLFVWGFISWVILPWHMNVANQFADEAAVSEVLKANSPASGIYYLPFSEENYTPGQVAAFANVQPDGMEMNMGKTMGFGLLAQFIAVFLVLGLLGDGKGRSYSCKVGFFSLAGLTIAFVSQSMYWNWFGFPTTYMLIMMADSVIAWTLAGLAVSGLIKA